MAEADFTQNRSEPTRATFQKQSWFSGTPTAEQDLIAQTHDIARGVTCLLELIEATDIANDCETSPDSPTLSPTDKGALLRLAIQSLGLLADKAESSISRADDAA